jgi:hypothetical protein
MLLGNVSVSSQQLRVGVRSIVVEDFFSRLDRSQASNSKTLFLVVDVRLGLLVLSTTHKIHLH